MIHIEVFKLSLFLTETIGHRKEDSKNDQKRPDNPQRPERGVDVVFQEETQNTNGD